MYSKKMVRRTFRTNKRSNYKKNNSSYSISKPRSKGNIYQLHEKYSKLAKEASSSGDRIQAEYYYQFADHYSRTMAELGIKSNENILSNESHEDDKNINIDKNDNTKDFLNSTDLKNSKNDKKESETEEQEDSESIESVSFIAEPVKKTK